MYSTNRNRNLKISKALLKS